MMNNGRKLVIIIIGFDNVFTSKHPTNTLIVILNFSVRKKRQLSSFVAATPLCD